MTSGMRKEVRYKIAALATFWWSYQGGTASAGQGVTQDISQGGVWVVSDTAPPPGSRIQMTVTLPRIEGSRYGMRLAGDGVVVRSESFEGAKEHNGPPGFGASIQFYPEQVGDTDVSGGWTRMTTASAYSN